MKETEFDIKKYKFTIEKQKNWNRKDMEVKIKDGIEGFTVTDLPFSSVLQVVWFIYIHFFKYFLDKDSDEIIFYNTQKRNDSFLKTVLKIYRNTTNHENTFNVIEYGNNLITSVSCNTRTQRQILNKINKIIDIKMNNEHKILGIFIVSGGGIFQKIYKKYLSRLDFLRIFPNNSIKIIQKTREILKSKKCDLKIFAAINTNINESLENILSKNADEYITQPPFLYSNFVNFNKSLNEDKRGSELKLRIGIPLLLSPWSLRFWYILCDINWKKNLEAKNLLKEFESKYYNDKSENKNEFKKYSLEFSKNLIYKCMYDCKNVIGFHIMPIGVGLKAEDLLVEIGFLDKNYEFLRNTKKYFKDFEKDKFKNEEKIYLENEFKEQSKSIIWDFNFLFWQNVEDFMNALHKNYTDAIGGSSDSNIKLAKYTAQTFLNNYKKIKDKKEKYYIEIGAAGARWCLIFLSELINLAKKENIQINNLKYVFLDYSDKVLENTKRVIGNFYQQGDYKIEIEYILLNNKIVSQEFKNRFSQNILRYHANNVYDNFPTNRILIRDNQRINIKMKTFIYKFALIDLLNKYNLEEDFAFELLNNLRENNNTHDFLDKIKSKFIENNHIEKFYTFWLELWYLFKFEQDVEGDLEQDISDNAIKNMLEIYDNLHEFGNIEIIDLLVYDKKDYNKFNGITKYDASLASYLNRFEIEKAFFEKNNSIKILYTNMKNFDGKAKQYLIEINKNKYEKLD